LSYLQYIRTISNWDGKGTANEPNILAVRLDRTMFTNKTDEPQVEWVASIMKEAMSNAVSGSAENEVQIEKTTHNRQDTPKAIQLSGFYTKNVDRIDWGTHAAEIVVRKDLLAATKPDGSPLLDKPKRTAELNTERQRWINEDIVKLQKKWTAETPWL